MPELPEQLAEELVRIIGVLRGMQLKKLPSVAETIDWGRTVLALGLDTIDDATIAATLAWCSSTSPISRRRPGS